jgi:hypothetical protein
MSTIYYFCYDIDEPRGGIKVLYRHVDILNKHGFSAYIVHQKSGFRCSWFANSTPVISTVDVSFKKEDYLVIPEEIFSELNKHVKGVKKIVFNQNCYYTFLNGYSLKPEETSTPYRDEDLVAAMVVSEDSKRYLSYVFPDLKIVQIRNSIDSSVFNYSEQKLPLISFMPRKNMLDVLQVINILKFRGVLIDFRILPIHNKKEPEVAQILRESLIFLSFGCPEGFSLPPAEAMACGCVVIGYHGMGGKEFFRPDFSYPVAHGDIVSFAQTVEKVIELYHHDKNIMIKKGKSASEYILANYSTQRQEKELLRVWSNIIKVL